MYDIIVFIGRFQPFHRGHLHTINEALKQAHNVIVCLGSSHSPRTVKNPFSAEERIQMISTSLNPEDATRVYYARIIDYKYNENQWIAGVQSVVDKLAQSIGIPNPKIGIIGPKKDESTYYLNHFKNWEYVETSLFSDGLEDNMSLSATKLRELLFSGYGKFIHSVLPQGSINFIEAFRKTDDFKQLKEEYEFLVNYEKQYEGYPYSVNFLTVDSVVIQSGHILLVQRRESPGRGLWACAGGHVGPNEDLLTAAIRELKEETNIKVPEKVLRGSVYHVQNFDHPDRSLRGRVVGKNARTLTVAHGFKLSDSEELPKVKASSDAAKVWWFPINQFMEMRDKMMEDHFDICYHMIQRI